MRILFINNRDSFVYNLVDYVGVDEPETIIVPNTTSIKEAKKIDPDAIVISPGPGNPHHPADIGSCLETIREFKGTPILGVCLGCQAICVAFGGTIAHSTSGPVHGKTSNIRHDGKTIFRGLPNPLMGGRYHSLAAVDVPDELEITALSDDGVVMGMRHTKHLIEGVQFHPESILTPCGRKMVQNFLEMVRHADR
ncbi:MAG: aminodeoxychorismate/anthranilate synthase component II [Methanosarcinales archaeon Met12]|nr:MAG: aminodeoxychorismate/anthranilate synthase component II [Methanosarcinales archaeon Met12]